MKVFIKLTILIFIIFGFIFNSLSQTISTDKFLEYLRQQIQIYYKVNANDIVIIYNDSDLNEKLKNYNKQNIDIKIRESTLANIITQNNIPIDIYKDNKLLKTVFLKIKVDIYKNVFVSTKNIAKGEIITNDNVANQRKLLSTIPYKNIYIDDNIYGAEATRDIKINTVITDNLIKFKPLILKGAIVSVKIKNKGLTLVAQGEALENGYLNKFIKVKIINFSTNKTVFGRVSGENEVEIEINE